MKYSVFTNQLAFMEAFNNVALLDFNDGAICCWVKWMSEGTKTTKVIYENRTYFHLGYDKMVSDLPMLRMEKRGARRRVDYLVSVGLLIRHPENKQSAKSLFALTDKFLQVTNSNNCDLDILMTTPCHENVKVHNDHVTKMTTPCHENDNPHDILMTTPCHENDNKEEVYNNKEEKEREEEAGGLARFSIQNLKSLSEKAIASQSLNEGQKQNTYAPLLHLCSKYASDESFCYWWDECIKDKKESHYVNLTPQKCLLWLQDAPEKTEDAIEELKNSVAKGWKTPFGKKEFQQKTVSKKNSLEKTKHYENENTNYSKKWKK